MNQSFCLRGNKRDGRKSWKKKKKNRWPPASFLSPPLAQLCVGYARFICSRRRICLWVFIYFEGKWEPWTRRLVVLHSSRTTTVISAVHSYMRPLVIPCCTETTRSASTKAWSDRGESVTTADREGHRVEGHANGWLHPCSSSSSSSCWSRYWPGTRRRRILTTTTKKRFENSMTLCCVKRVERSSEKGEKMSH